MLVPVPIVHSSLSVPVLLQSTVGRLRQGWEALPLSVMEASTHSGGCPSKSAGKVHFGRVSVSSWLEGPSSRSSINGTEGHKLLIKQEGKY